ncbi:MAG: glycosyltransferase [Bdellovibrionales bacterium]|nr:glycosyltransferase [Bdellovibrionales bacterium]
MEEVQAYPVEDPNPYIGQLYSGMDKHGFQVTRLSLGSSSARTLHIHWPEYLLRISGRPVSFVAWKVLARLFLKRMRGGRIIWTVHNEWPHDTPNTWANRTALQAFLAVCSDLIFLSTGSQERFCGQYPFLTKRVGKHVIPHGHYLDIYPNKVAKAEARRDLAVAEDAEIGLFFGSLRGYKGIEELVHSFSKLDRAQAKLLVAGRSRPEFSDHYRALFGTDERINYTLDWVEPSRVQFYFNAADFVILPYTQVTNSGVLYLALSFRKLVVAKRHPVFEELANGQFRDWLLLYDQELDASTWQQAVRRSRDLLKAEVPDLTPFSWETIRRQTCEVYRQG